MKTAFFAAFLLLQAPSPAPAGGTITGRIGYADGTPVEGTLISAVRVPERGERRGNPAALNRTNAAGDYRLTRLPPGRYYIQTGFIQASLYYPGVVAEGDATIIAIEPNSTIENLNFLLPYSASAFRIQGRVIYPPDQPAPATPAQVRATGGDISRGITAPIAPDGRFEFARAGSGEYWIEVVPAPPGMQATTVKIADRDVTGIEIHVPRIVNVAVSTAVDGGGARPRFTMSFAGPVEKTAAPRPNGTLGAELLEGEYRVTLSSLPSGYYLRSLTSGTTDLVTNLLRIGYTAATVPIVATFGRYAGVRVSGHLKIPADDAVPAVRTLSLTGTAVNVESQTLVEEDGTFELTNIPPGAYTARVSLSASVSSPPFPITIPPRDVRDLEIAVPSLVEVRGRAVVDGNGLPPKFSLYLVRGAASKLVSSDPDKLPVLPREAMPVRQRAAPTGVQIIDLDVAPLPDGTFTMKLPEGDYRVAVADTDYPGSIPPAYFIRSIDHGAARLLNEPMRVSAHEPAELQIGFGTVGANPWARVRGNLINADPAKGPYRVQLSGNTTATAEALVNPDGTFEFSRILKANSYALSILPKNPIVSTVPVLVADEDVEGVRVVIPRERQVPLRAFLEGGGPVPGFMLAARASCASGTFDEFGCAGSVRIVPKVAADGTARITLPEDSRRITLESMPLGYIVKSITYGTTDLSREPLQPGTPPSEIRVTFALDPAIPFASLTGRVRNLDPELRGVRIVLSDVAAFSTFEEPLQADGSFNFSRLPQGTYTPTLTGGFTSGLLSPGAIVVSGPDLAGVEITAPHQSARQPAAPVQEETTGTRLTELGGGISASANEAGAVANVRTLNTALVTYLSVTRGQYGAINDLIEAGLIDESFTSTKNGFNFSIINLGEHYVAAAVPVSPGAGRYAFYSTPDAVVRYSTAEHLAPTGGSGSPVN